MDGLMQTTPLLRQDHDGVVTLTLNRPSSFNVLSEDMLESLQAALDDIAQDEAVRCVVLAAEGRAFCAGHDLKQMRTRPEHNYYTTLFATCSRVMQSIATLPVPVIARVHGMATAAGCQLVATCDLAIASSTASFAVSGIDVGLFCSTPAVALSRCVPQKQAMEMLLTGRFIPAEEALRIGLVNQVVRPAALDEAIEILAGRICRKSPTAVRAGKAMFYRQRTMELADAYDYAGSVMAGNMMASDAAEGIDAFIAKRLPSWCAH